MNIYQITVFIVWLLWQKFWQETHHHRHRDLGACRRWISRPNGDLTCKKNGRGWEKLENHVASWHISRTESFELPSCKRFFFGHSRVCCRFCFGWEEELKITKHHLFVWEGSLFCFQSLGLQVCSKPEVWVPGGILVALSRQVWHDSRRIFTAKSQVLLVYMITCFTMCIHNYTYIYICL